MTIEQSNNVNLPIRSYVIEGFVGGIVAHHTGETWNGYDCPVFSPEQVETFVHLLNKDDDFEASLNNGVVTVRIISSDETIEIVSENGLYQFNGWCFNAI